MHNALNLCHIGFSHGVSVHKTETHLVEVDNPQDTEPRGTAESSELVGGWNVKYLIAIEQLIYTYILLLFPSDYTTIDYN